MSPDDPNFNILRAAFYGVLAAVGGFIGYLMRTIDSRLKIQWQLALVQGAAAGFVGLLVLFICDATQLSNDWTGAVVGVTGWMGAKASIQMLETLVFKKLGIEPKPQEPIRGRQDDTPE